MSFQQIFDTSDTHFGSEGDLSLSQKRNSVSPTVTTENVTECFDCNICFESSREPVVTLCGHLYCWPCIYEWLQVQNPSVEADDEQPKCPVCKAYISSSSLVPLYGRGSSLSELEPKKPHIDMVIPNRPPALGMNALVSAPISMVPDSNQQQHPQHQAFHHQQYLPLPISNYTSITPPTLDGTITSGFSSPTVNMVGELVFATMFRASDTSLFAYPHSNSYSLHGNSSPRLRSQEMQLDKSLNRVTIFLFCCFALCLILF